MLLQSKNPAADPGRGSGSLRPIQAVPTGRLQIMRAGTGSCQGADEDSSPFRSLHPHIRQPAAEADANQRGKLHGDHGIDAGGSLARG